MKDLIPASDIVALKRALAASGYKGEKLALMGASDLAIIRSMSDVADDTLRKIGVNVDYQMTDWGTLLTRRQKREPVDQGGWSLYPTAVDGVEQNTPLTHRFVRALGLKAPSGWLQSPELEATWNAFASESDNGKRKALAERLQVLTLQEVPSIPLGQYMQNTALRKNLVGRLDGATLFWNLRRSS